MNLGEVANKLSWKTSVVTHQKSEKLYLKKTCTILATKRHKKKKQR